ncbi:heat shock factor protein 2 isoform X1 [Stegostoma tigrinum]|uniref:heat shock factor protein 2 isoform X1 n=1 Tax=Stegostoma tigrinum TaxID=3053191 RepID=UPI00202B49F9|nr:heat shock factor protein 2 isoform X1 [Stegostoma tigrinum]
MKQSVPVPAFLTKLWALVEDPDTNEFICWNQNGHGFLVLDEQRFAKEILPKYFKHNNMASFVRQLNMYGFRKVLNVDAGIVKQERDGPVEFQHPYFKQGQDELLENIKRKVSSIKPEEAKIQQEGLNAILSSVQELQGKQENLDSRLTSLKWENETLWREIADLRQKHAQQQQVIRQIIKFIVSLVQNNQIVTLKRKRPIMINTTGPSKPKYFHHLVKEPDDTTHVPVHGPNGVKQCVRTVEDIVICDITDTQKEKNEESTFAVDDELPKVVQQDNSLCEETTKSQEQLPTSEIMDVCSTDNVMNTMMNDNVETTNAESSISSEDPISMMDSILNENAVISQNINLLGKIELMDYLDSIDCSLEDFQATLSGKQFNVDAEVLSDVSSVKENRNGAESKVDENKSSDTGKQLMQYNMYPVLTFLDGNASSLLEKENTTSGLKCTCEDNHLQKNENTEKVEQENKKKTSQLFKLEPLTEEEAREETLFYLCELTPSNSLDGENSLLDS